MAITSRVKNWYRMPECNLLLSCFRYEPTSSVASGQKLLCQAMCWMIGLLHEWMNGLCMRMGRDTGMTCARRQCQDAKDASGMAILKHQLEQSLPEQSALHHWSFCKYVGYLEPESRFTVFVAGDVQISCPCSTREWPSDREQVMLGMTKFGQIQERWNHI